MSQRFYWIRTLAPSSTSSEVLSHNAGMLKLVKSLGFAAAFSGEDATVRVVGRNLVRELSLDPHSVALCGVSFTAHVLRRSTFPPPLA
jgi:hypothetical protein